MCSYKNTQCYIDNIKPIFFKGLVRDVCFYYIPIGHNKLSLQLRVCHMLYSEGLLPSTWLKSKLRALNFFMKNSLSLLNLAIKSRMLFYVNLGFVTFSIVLDESIMDGLINK